jgi:hypothetical protein
VQGRQYFTGTGLGGRESLGPDSGGGDIRRSNDLALVINTVLPLMLLIVLQSRSVLARLYCALVSCVFVYSVFLTASRGGLLCLGAMAILLFQRKFGKFIGVAAGMIVLVAIIVLGPRMDTLSTEDASSYGRLEAWSLAMDLFKGSPLFGIGYDHFMDYHFRTAHNSYLLCAAELGIFGLYPWLMMFFISYKNTTRGKDCCARSAAGHDVHGSLAHRLLPGRAFAERTYHHCHHDRAGARRFRACSCPRADRFALIEKRDLALGLC